MIGRRAPFFSPKNFGLGNRTDTAAFRVSFGGRRQRGRRFTRTPAWVIVIAEPLVGPVSAEGCADGMGRVNGMGTGSGCATGQGIMRRK